MLCIMIILFPWYNYILKNIFLIIFNIKIYHFSLSINRNLFIQLGYQTKIYLIIIFIDINKNKIKIVKICHFSYLI